MHTTLNVPGARIHCKTRGSGPVLLLLPGGDGDADACDALAAHLDSVFTIVTYDRRGLSRSTSTGTPPDLPTHADDAHQILAAITDTPALVFGSSIGAIIALELTTRHPDQIRCIVAHEPPINALLPDDARAELAGAQLNIEQAHRRDGAFAAITRFGRLGGVDPTDREPDVRLTPPGPARLPNLEFFLTYDAPAVRQYQPDQSALHAQAERIIPATGATTTGPIPRCAHALAELLKTEVTIFPGGHNGYILRPRAFAHRLHKILGTTHAQR